MTDKEALEEIDRQEKRFAAAGFGNGLRLAKSAREYYQTIVKCRQKSAEVAAECAAGWPGSDPIDRKLLITSRQFCGG